MNTAGLRVVVFALLLLRAAGAAAGELTAKQNEDLVQALQTCRATSDQSLRLACFDEIARRNAPPRFSGKLGVRTQPFVLDRPHVLRFRSDGVIFVLYLLDEKGAVVQNLHIGGAGEDSYLIESPGTYSLQIDGSAEWRIWLDPA